MNVLSNEIILRTVSNDIKDKDNELADILPTGIRSSELVDDSLAMSNDTRCSVASTTHLGDSSISPMYFEATAPAVILTLVKLIGADIVEGSVFTQEVPL